MRQFASADTSAAGAKDNLWQQDEEGNWRIDPERDALRMANHTRVYHTRPSREVLLEAVTRGSSTAVKAPSSSLPRPSPAPTRICSPHPSCAVNSSTSTAIKARRRPAVGWCLNHGPIAEDELEHRLGRYGLNPCGEILGADFHCNLAEVHLNQIDPSDDEAQRDAFRAAALSVACLLNHKFEVKRYRQSRAWDPIVGVSFTGLFDFFVHAFGTPGCSWWEAGRPNTEEGLAFKRP